MSNQATPPTPAATAASNGWANSLVGSVMGAYDAVVGAIPHDATRAALLSQRSQLESAVAFGADQGTATAREATRALRATNLTDGWNSFARSPVLCNAPLPLFAFVPAASALLALRVVQLRRANAIAEVPSVEAGEAVSAEPVGERMRRWLFESAAASGGYHAKQMVLYGAAVCLGLYITKVVMPLPPSSSDSGKSAGGTGSAEDDDAVRKFAATLNVGLNYARRVLGAAIVQRKDVPLSVVRIVRCDVHRAVVNMLRTVALAYPLHAVVVLYGERAQSDFAKTCVAAAHIAGVAADVALGVAAPFASCLPPLAKVIASAAYANALLTATVPTTAPLRNTSDPLRVCIATLSTAKTCAVLATSTYGAAAGGLWLPQAAALALLAPSLRATSLPCTNQPLTRWRSLPVVAAGHVAADVAMLAAAAILRRGSLLPMVSAAPFSRRGASSIATVLSFVDLVAIIGIVGFQAQRKHLAALQERVVRVPVPAALFEGENLSAVASPTNREEWAKEFDFATPSSEPQTDRLSETQTSAAAAAGAPAS